MGYSIEQVNSEFYIKAENLQACANAVLNALRDKEQVGWVRSSDINEYMGFSEIAEKFRWNVRLNDEGDVCDIEFNGEKLGEDIDLFLNSIAPYVLDESYISFRGEEDERWRYLFENGTMVEQNGTISYE